MNPPTAEETKVENTTPVDPTADLEQYTYCKLPLEYTNEKMIKTLEVADTLTSAESMAPVDSTKTINELV